MQQLERIAPLRKAQQRLLMQMLDTVQQHSRAADVAATYAIEPIRQRHGADPVTTMMEKAWLAVHWEPPGAVAAAGHRLVAGAAA